MPMTTIRLSEDLKARVTDAAKHAGTASHNFILEVIAGKADQAERQDAFHALADARYAQFIADGKTIPWNEMRRHLEARLAGKIAVRPVARRLAR